jgi:hypothetical protein
MTSSGGRSTRPAPRKIITTRPPLQVIVRYLNEDSINHSSSDFTASGGRICTRVGKCTQGHRQRNCGLWRLVIQTGGTSNGAGKGRRQRCDRIVLREKGRDLGGEWLVCHWQPGLGSTRGGTCGRSCCPCRRIFILNSGVK